ncbi:hypothetical protein ACQP0C_07790 [Nocardia sp. CA-129566]|uniref:hypothetical protein n=1 Tax=Nocardia sp. CA-129566 TaxID=3239976 RepID=UPI003D960DD1
MIPRANRFDISTLAEWHSEFAIDFGEEIRRIACQPLRQHPDGQFGGRLVERPSSFAVVVLPVGTVTTSSS